MQFSDRLDGNNVVLRPLGLCDFAFFCRLVRDPEVRRYLGGPVPRRALPSRFVAYRQGDWVSASWVVRMRRANTAIGLVELGPHKDGQDNEISYQFLPDHWGRGLAADAMRAVLTHGLRDCGLSRILAETQSANVASRRLLERVGMAEVQRVHRFGAEQVIYATRDQDLVSGAP